MSERRRYVPARNAPTVAGQTGNVAGLVHGASSSRAVEPVAAGIVEQVLAGAPYLNEPHYRLAVEALAVTEARLRLVDAYVASKGLFNRKGRPWAAVEYGWRLERLADNLRSSLGLTPASRARLGQAVAATGVDLARLWAGQAGGQRTRPAARRPTAAEPAPESGDAAGVAGAQDPLRPAGGLGDGGEL